MADSHLAQEFEEWSAKNSKQINHINIGDVAAHISKALGADQY